MENIYLTNGDIRSMIQEKGTKEGDNEKSI